MFSIWIFFYPNILPAWHIGDLLVVESLQDFIRNSFKGPTLVSTSCYFSSQTNLLEVVGPVSRGKRVATTLMK